MMALQNSLRKSLSKFCNTVYSVIIEFSFPIKRNFVPPRLCVELSDIQSPR